jgi:hypothetical protein
LYKNLQKSFEGFLHNKEIFLSLKKIIFMRKLYFLSFLFSLFLNSCGAVINESISKNYSYLPIDAKIAILVTP